MEYAVYFEADGTVCRLPVNPEDITRERSLDTKQYRVLAGGQVTLPEGSTLETFSFETEFPCGERSYTNKGFRSADEWEKDFRQWQQEKKAVRFIACCGTDNDINTRVFVTQVQSVEKAGEEGDKYISLKLLEYRAPVKKYVSVQYVKKVLQTEAAESGSASVNRSYTVVKGDTLWAIARKYYGSGSLYTKLVSANPGIKNPNLIYPGQILTIPG